MTASTPLSESDITATEYLSADRLYATVSTGANFILELVTGSREHVRKQESLLRELTGRYECFLKYCGVSSVYSHEYHVFQSVSRMSMRHVTNSMKNAGQTAWNAGLLETYIKQMCVCVHTLHTHSLLHCKVNPRHFYLHPNNKVLLGGLTHLKSVPTLRFPSACQKELTWLGISCASLLLFLDFEVLLPWNTNKIIEKCTEIPVFQGQIREIVEGTLRGEWKNSYLSENDTEITQESEICTQIQDENDSFPHFSSQTFISQCENSDFSSVSGFISTKNCEICRESSDFSTPCLHFFCFSCFIQYFRMLLVQITYENQLNCPKCGDILQKSFVFEHIQSDPTVLNSLKLSLTPKNSLICPNCHSTQLIFLENSPQNVTCSKCRYNFCSFCMENAHVYDRCRRLG